MKTYKINGKIVKANSLTDAIKTIKDSAASDIVREIKSKYPNVQISFENVHSSDFDRVDLTFRNYPGEEIKDPFNKDDPRYKELENWKNFLSYLHKKYMHKPVGPASLHRKGDYLGLVTFHDSTKDSIKDNRSQNENLAKEINNKFVNKMAEYQAKIYGEADGLDLSEISASKDTTRRIIEFVKSKGKRVTYTPDDGFLEIHDSIEDGYNKYANETNVSFLKEAIAEMKRYERNWDYMEPREKRNIAPNSGLKELRENISYAENRLRELQNKKDSTKDDLGSDVSQYQKWVDYDMTRYHKISGDTMYKIKKAGLDVVKDRYGDYEVIAHRRDEKMLEDMDIDELTEEEKRAVEDYREAIQSTTNPELLKIYAHILKEETEHIEELQLAKEEGFEDSIKDYEFDFGLKPGMIIQTDRLDKRAKYKILKINGNIATVQRLEEPGFTYKTDPYSFRPTSIRIDGSIKKLSE